MISALILQLLGPYSNDVLVFVTIGLVILTGVYAVQTKRTVAVLEKTAKLEFLPHIKAHIHMVGPMNLKLRITNIGKSSASEVQVTFTVIGVANVTREWMHQLLGPNQSQDFFIPTTENEEQSSFPYFENNPTKVQISATYKDILGNQHKSNDEINVSEFVAQFKRTKSIYMEDRDDVFANNIHTISEEIKKVTRGLSTIGDEMSERKRKDMVAYCFSIIYYEMKEMSIDSKSDLVLLIYSLENELKLYRRKDVLDLILKKIGEINIELHNKIDSQLKNFAIIE